MDDRAKFKAAYDEWVKSREAYDVWINNVITGDGPIDKPRGLQLAVEVQQKLFAFMQAATPFMYPKPPKA